MTYAPAIEAFETPELGAAVIEGLAALGPVGWGILAAVVIGAVTVGIYESEHSQALNPAAAEPCVTCDEDEDPCKELRKGSGPGKYRGGAHGFTKGPTGDGLDSHHMPSAKANQMGGGPSRDDAPAIQMDPEDHEDTKSYGPSKDAIEYRKAQAELIKQGKLKEAIEKDIANVKSIAASKGDPTKYDQAIKEMQAYADCLQKEIDKNKLS